MRNRKNEIILTLNEKQWAIQNLQGTHLTHQKYTFHGIRLSCVNVWFNLWPPTDHTSHWIHTQYAPYVPLSPSVKYNISWDWHMHLLSGWEMVIWFMVHSLGQYLRLWTQREWYIVCKAFVETHIGRVLRCLSLIKFLYNQAYWGSIQQPRVYHYRIYPSESKHFSH